MSFKNSPVRHTIPYSTELRHSWEEIRKLDEEQNWTERTQVVTKEDHKLYIDIARVINVSNVLFLINMHVKPIQCSIAPGSIQPSFWSFMAWSAARWCHTNTVFVDFSLPRPWHEYFLPCKRIQFLKTCISYIVKAWKKKKWFAGLSFGPAAISFLVCPRQF